MTGERLYAFSYLKYLDINPFHRLDESRDAIQILAKSSIGQRPISVSQ